MLITSIILGIILIAIIIKNNPFYSDLRVMSTEEIEAVKSNKIFTLLAILASMFVGMSIGDVTISQPLIDGGFNLIAAIVVEVGAFITIYNSSKKNV